MFIGVAEDGCSIYECDLCAKRMDTPPLLLAKDDINSAEVCEDCRDVHHAGDSKQVAAFLARHENHRLCIQSVEKVDTMYTFSHDGSDFDLGEIIGQDSIETESDSLYCRDCYESIWIEL